MVFTRTGTTAYCNHLVNTGQVHTDGGQELFERTHVGSYLMMKLQIQKLLV